MNSYRCHCCEGRNVSQLFDLTETCSEDSTWEASDSDSTVGFRQTGTCNSNCNSHWVKKEWQSPESPENFSGFASCSGEEEVEKRGGETMAGVTFAVETGRLGENLWNWAESCWICLLPQRTTHLVGPPFQQCPGGVVKAGPPGYVDAEAVSEELYEPGPNPGSPCLATLYCQIRTQTWTTQ